MLHKYLAPTLRLQLPEGSQTGSKKKIQKAKDIKDASSSTYRSVGPLNHEAIIFRLIISQGGSGFIAAHILDLLLEHGHSVVTTVRSQEKATKIKEAHPDMPKNKLDFAIVEDIAKEGAFDKAVVSDPPFEAVIHTASPVRMSQQVSIAAF